MKKIVLVICLFISIVGCSANKINPTNNEELENNLINQDKIEIKLWLDNEDYANSLIPAIESALPHIKIKYEQVSGGDAATKLELDGPAGNGVDVFIQPHDYMAKGIQSQILLPLNSDLAQEIENRMMPASVGTVKQGETYYGIPLSTETIALFYNKTLLDELGFDIASSFEEMIEQANTYNNTSENKYIIRFSPSNAYEMHLFLTSAGFEIFGPNHNDKTAVNLNSTELIEGLKLIENFKQYLNVPAADLNWDTIHGEFVKGNVPYIITGPWSITELKQAADFEWGITTIPTINGIQPTTFSGNIIASISAYTKYPNEAREVVEFMASEQGLQIMYDTTGRIPALKDTTVIKGIDKDPYTKGILAQAKYTEPMPLLVEMSYYWPAAYNMLTSVWEGLVTPEEAAIKAQNEFDMSIELSK